MQQVTALQLLNWTRLALQFSKRLTISATDLEDQQILAGINWARNCMFRAGSCYWDEFWGTVITVAGKRSYDMTPVGSNYCPTSRTFSGAALNHVTLAPKSAVSFDDTYNATTATATGASPAVTITSVGTLQNSRVTASIWLATGSVDPGTVTLTLTDGAGGQTVTKTVTLTGNLNRFAISGYFTSASSTVKLQVSWTVPTGVVVIDACQIEPADYATEYIDNTTTSPKARTIFAAPDRMLGIGKYTPGTMPIPQDYFVYDQSLYPNEKALFPFASSDIYTSNKGGVINVNPSPAVDTHVIYRAKAVPVDVASATDTVNVPPPWHWVIVRGATAWMDNAIYDIGANQDTARVEKAFIAEIEDMLAMAEPSPNWTVLPNSYPRMMR